MDVNMNRNIGSVGVVLEDYTRKQHKENFLPDISSGCRESDPDLALPKRVYYHCTTPRV